VSVPFADLAASYPRSIVRRVLNTEVACGRMVEEDEYYAIAPGAFDRETLAALAALGPVEPDLHDAPARDRVAARGDDRPRPSHGPPDGAEGGREAVSAT
jgi:hypothetical protein